MRKSFLIIILAVVVLVIVAGFLFGLTFLANTSKNTQTTCTTETKVCPDDSLVGRTGAKCEFAPCPIALAFGSPVTFIVGKQVTFTDGLVVSLASINDSRCKPGVVCVWAGELSAVLRISSGAVGSTSGEIQLGATTKPKITQYGYVFLLNSVTEREATVTVSKEVKPLGNCYVGGCSSEICSDQKGIASPCIYQPEFTCYKNAVCQRQANGQCGWTQTLTLTTCLHASQ